MQKNNDAYIFTLDEARPELCSGWYVRKDGGRDDMDVTVNGRTFFVAPDLARPDVAQAGLGGEICGFLISLDPPATPGSEIVFKAADGEILHIEKLPLPYHLSPASYKGDAVNTRLMRLVEPFVEMDIAKLRASLMEGKIYAQYRQMYVELLARKNDVELRSELIEILADMKTTLHLLSAAYLDYTRYREPDYLDRLPDFCPAVTNIFTVEMQGDITGSNWESPSDNARWIGDGERTSLLVPNPGSGEYEVEIVVEEERAPGDLGRFRMEINGQPKKPLEEASGCPCRLRYEFRIEEGAQPFLTLHFIRDIDGASNEFPPSLRVSSLKFTRLAS